MRNPPSVQSLILAFLPSVLAAQEPALAQPIELFDGATLTGWRGDPAVWRVENGCIVGSTEGLDLRQNTFLIWEGGDIADFELRFDVLLEGNRNNSGVQYRSRELAGGTFGAAGYQCDVHPDPAYFGMLYEERGAGIVCRHGEFVVRDADGGLRVVGKIAARKPRDLGEWHSLAVIARGDLLIHELDGAPIAIVQDHRRDAPRHGILALQVHAGPAMTVRFKNLRLTKLPPEEVATPPPLVTALLAGERARAGAASGAVPQWIWDGEVSAEDDAFFRRTFELDAVPEVATVAAACDNHCRIWLNGQRVASGDDWAAPLQVDVQKHLKQGKNVVAVHGWNDGGPAGLVARVSWRNGDRSGEFVSDASWRCSDDDPDGWNDTGFDDSTWPTATVQAALGADGAPWSGAMKADALATAEAPGAPQLALPAEGLEGPGAAGALKLLDVPRAYGSWVSLCADDEGRLYASDQSRGLYRVTPARALGEFTTIERIDVDLDGAQGLCWFHNVLYAVVGGRNAGLYRLSDTDGDDLLDRVERLRELRGGGEHGPHAVVPAPDGQNLLVICGNHTELTEIAAGMPERAWGEDRLLPKFEDPRGHARGRKAPGGWICRVDPDGEHWELLCWGFRNSYDVAVLPNGELYVYDSDMEWDMGLPWYRPTRILKIVQGADYGWRSGSNKWYADYPDSPKAVCDIGPGSPTGMVVHGGSVLALDWTFGTIYALPIGSDEAQPWLTGTPLPVTDAVSVGGHLYVITGGRGLPSTLLDVTAEPPPAVASAARGDGSFDVSADRLAGARLDFALSRVVRAEGEERWQQIEDLADAVPFDGLPPARRIAWLRAHALALLGMEPVTDEQREILNRRLLPLLPTGDERVDGDLIELLAFLDAPGLLEAAIPLLSPMRPAAPPPWAEVITRNGSYGGAIRTMLDNMPPTGQIAIANALRTVRRGWTLEQRRALFTFLAEARQRKGGASYDGYLQAMIDAAWETCTPAEQNALAELVDKARAELPKFRASKPQGPGRAWQLAEAKALAAKGLADRDLGSGHNIFHAVGCASCHYFAGEGGSHGPDLTSLGNKFTADSVLEAILEPSAVVSDQYAASVVTKRDGTTMLGHAVRVAHEGSEYWEVVPAVAEAELLRIPAAEVASIEPSKLSPMPAGLIDALNPDELLDLLAFLLSRGR